MSDLTLPIHRISYLRLYLRYMTMIAWLICSLSYLYIAYILHTHTTLSIYIDGSLSMMTKDLNGQSRFEFAQDIVSRIARTLPATTEYHLVLVGSVPVPIDHVRGGDRLLDVIDKIDPHRIILDSRFAGSVLNTLWGYHQSLYTHPLIVISDGYQTTGSYQFVAQVPSVILGIGTRYGSIGRDRASRTVYTPVDTAGLHKLTQDTHSTLYMIDNIGQVDPVLQTLQKLNTTHIQTWIQILWMLTSIVLLIMRISSIFRTRGMAQYRKHKHQFGGG